MLNSTAYYNQFAMAAGIWGGGYSGGAWAGAGVGYAGGAGYAGAAAGMQSGAMVAGRMDWVSISMMQMQMCCCHHENTRISEDPYGVAQSGQGLRSNLANSPETMLALRDIMKSGKAKSYEDVQKVLKDEYGIHAEVGEIKSVNKDGKEVKGKGLKFANGDYFVDGNGDNQLTTADYKFDDAVKALKEKYNLGDEDLKGITDRMKARASFTNEHGHGHGGFSPWGMGGHQGMGGFRPGMVNAMGGMYGPSFGMNWMWLFSQAYQFAG